MDPALRAAFRSRVLAGIEADLAREDREEAARRSEVLPALTAVLERTRADQRCGRAWLFGSFAWGHPGERSDIDVLVERCADPDTLAVEIWRATDRPAHVIELERAPASLVERAQRDGLPL